MDVRGLRITLYLCATIVLGLAAAAPAQAAFGMTINEAAPASTDAGANSDFTLDVAFTGDDSVKDLTVHLPPGLVGDPTSTPLCSETQLNGDTCPETSQIGTTTTDAAILNVVPLEIPGKVYNVQPRTGEPARLGIVLTPPVGAKVILQSAAKLRGDDFGLDTILEGIPNTADGVPIVIKGISLTLDGAFMRNPTSCGTQTTTADAVSYLGVDGTGTNSFESVNCEDLPFSPSFTGKVGSPGHTAPFTLPPQTTVISQDEGEAGLIRAQVKLPDDIGGNNPYLSNTCSLANFQAHTCPAASIVGQATAESPLQEQALTGPMALVENSGGLPLLGLDLQGALALQLFGDLVLFPNGDKIDTLVVFDGLPDIPISRFELTLVEDKLNIVGRDLCQPPPFFYTTEFTSYADEVLTGDTQATIEGCAPTVVDPTSKARIRNSTSDNPRLKLIVRKGSASLSDIVVKAPPEASFGNASKGIVVTAEGQEIDSEAIDRAKRKLTIDLPDSDDVKVKVSKGTLRLRDSVKKGDELAFSVDVTDADSNNFTLPTPALAR